MKKISLAASLMFAVSTASIAADTNAHEPHFYGGINLGMTSWGSLGSDVTNATGIDDSNVSWGGFAGVQTLPWLAFEFGYQNLGEADLKNVSGSYDAQTINLTAKFSYDVAPQLAIYGKLGTQWYDWNANGSGVYSNDNGWTPHLGAGLAYEFNKNWSGALDYTWYNDIGGPDISYFGIAAIYHWR
ncbi:outer membrane beta-barrel protein [Vibrio rarus]|uniref:outer membrane beta-barrel protein n=1 Tax=Vibrio rarus TaxID=413403 RepID=UPI0021C30E7F|nr:outer membrane beta-barrel protein [Vibrio rarus]